MVASLKIHSFSLYVPLISLLSMPKRKPGEQRGGPACEQLVSAQAGPPEGLQYHPNKVFPPSRARIRHISSSCRRKSNISMFSRILSLREDLGITEIPC